MNWPVCIPSTAMNVSLSSLYVLAAVDELAGVHTLNGDERLLVKLVPVLVAEGNLRERRAAAGVADHLLHEALDVALALREVQRPELGGALARTSVGLEDSGLPLTLGPDNLPHESLSASLLHRGP